MKKIAKRSAWFVLGTAALATVCIGVYQLYAKPNDVEAAIAKTDSCRFSVRTVFRDGRTVEGIATIRMDPRSYRFERVEHGEATEIDVLRSDQNGISLNVPQKTFRITPRRATNELPPAMLITRIASYFTVPERSVGNKMVDDIACDGVAVPFEILDQSMGPGTATMWVRQDNRLPALVELQSNSAMGTKTFSDFNWDVDCLESDFSSAPPSGFKDKTPAPPDLDEQTNHIVNALRIYSQADSGRYPPYEKIYGDVVINRLKELLHVTKDTPSTDQGYANYVDSTMGFATMSMICRDNGDYRYHGRTVDSSKTRKVLFRWKLDDGRYQVIFGDLKSKLVSANELADLERGAAEG